MKTNLNKVMIALQALAALCLIGAIKIWAPVCGKKDPKQVAELLYQFGLEDRADFFPHQLSGGQRRRAMAARALIHDPALILADEPTNDLDEHWSQEIIRILKEQTQKGTAVVMVTHNSRWAEMANRRCRLEEGVLIDIEK